MYHPFNCITLINCRCEFVGETCHSVNFSKVNTDWGFCYVFNGDPQEQRDVYLTGEGGLYLPTDYLHCYISVHQYTHCYVNKLVFTNTDVMILATYSFIVLTFITRPRPICMFETALAKQSHFNVNTTSYPVYSPMDKYVTKSWVDMDEAVSVLWVSDELGGLHLFLNAQMYDYTIATSSGFRIRVHDPVINLREMSVKGISLPTGSHTKIALRKKEVISIFLLSEFWIGWIATPLLFPIA